MKMAELTVHNMDTIGRKNTKRVLLVSELEWLQRKFEHYTMKVRIPMMFRNGGVVPGPYGKDYKKWPANTAWVRRAKHDSRPLFKHNRSKSTLEGRFTMRLTGRQGGRNASGARLRWRLENDHPAIGYIETARRAMTVFAKRARALAIPWGFGITKFARFAKIGPQPARIVTQFQRGDINRIQVWLRDSFLKGEETT